jgi:hypothetical protein
MSILAKYENCLRFHCKITIVKYLFFIVKSLKLNFFKIYNLSKIEVIYVYKSIHLI